MFRLFIFLMLITTSAFAQQNYVRKKLVPTYYIPHSEIKQQEKLKEQQRPFQEVVQEKIKQIEQNPEYQKIYDAYWQDAVYISENGKYPDDTQINKDLAEMTSEQKFVVK